MTGPRALQLDPGTGHFSLPVQTLTYRQLCMAACCMSRDAAAGLIPMTIFSTAPAGFQGHFSHATSRRCVLAALLCDRTAVLLFRLLSKTLLDFGAFCRTQYYSLRCSKMWLFGLRQSFKIRYVKACTRANHGSSRCWWKSYAVSALPRSGKMLSSDSVLGENPFM